MPACCIIPPYILRAIAAHGDRRRQAAAWSTLTDSEQFRGERRILAALAPVASTGTGMKRRTIYDARHRYTLPGRLVRGEKDPKSKDTAVNEANSLTD
jgi:hypothetical protein